MILQIDYICFQRILSVIIGKCFSITAFHKLTMWHLVNCYFLFFNIYSSANFNSILIFNFCNKLKYNCQSKLRLLPNVSADKNTMRHGGEDKLFLYQSPQVVLCERPFQLDLVEISKVFFVLFFFSESFRIFCCVFFKSLQKFYINTSVSQVFLIRKVKNNKTIERHIKILITGLKNPTHVLSPEKNIFVQNYWVHRNFCPFFLRNNN